MQLHLLPFTPLLPLNVVTLHALQVLAAVVAAQAVYFRATDGDSHPAPPHLHVADARELLRVPVVHLREKNIYWFLKNKLFKPFL